MADLIDRQALGVGRCSPDILPAAYCAGWNGLLNLINKAPTVDAVEVVRCGTPCRWLYDEPDDYCCMNHKGLVRITPDSFCSYGRRVENAADCRD